MDLLEQLKKNILQQLQGTAQSKKPVNQATVPLSQWNPKAAPQAAPKMQAPFKAYQPLRIRDASRTAASLPHEFITKPLIRLGYEGSMSLAGDKRALRPQGRVQQALLGKEPLVAFSNPQRPARQFVEKHNLPGWLAPAAITAGVIGDVALVNPASKGLKVFKFAKGFETFEDFIKAAKKNDKIWKEGTELIANPEVKNIEKWSDIFANAQFNKSLKGEQILTQAAGNPNQLKLSNSLKPNEIDPRLAGLPDPVTGQSSIWDGNKWVTKIQQGVEKTMGKLNDAGIVGPDSQKGFIKLGEEVNLPGKGKTKLKEGQGVSSDDIIPQKPITKAENFLNQDQAAIDDFERMVLNAPDKPKATQIVGDSAALKRGEAKTLSGQDGFGRVGQLDDEVKGAFQDWVNQRKASRLEGWLQQKNFKQFDELGLDGILRYQAKAPGFKTVKKFFDDKYNELQKAGVKMGFKDDYLPQLWDNTPEEIQRVFGRSLSEKASFQMSSVVKNYEEGIKAGLKPRFETIGELAGWYESRANRLLADKKFFKYLADNSMILPSGKAPQGWKVLSPDYFPKIEAQMDGTKFFGNYSAPDELAKVINNYLKNPDFGSVQTFANYVTRVKNMTLNFGIPGTGINMHGINELARHTLMGTGSNPVSRFVEGAVYMAHPAQAQKTLDRMIGKIGPRASRAGLTFSNEDYLGFGKEAQSFAGEFSKTWEHYFATPLFNKMIPAMKLTSWDNLVKGGMKEKDAATLVNNVYGGINWEAMGRNRDVQNMFRSIFLTPDWGESSIRLGGRLLNIVNPKDMSKVQNRYRQMAATIMASYVAHNVANKITSGHYSYENDPGHVFEIEMGTTESGQKRYLRPYGTALDMVRLPAEALVGMAKGDYSYVARAVRNRLSIPVGVGAGALSDQDYRGQTIGWRGRDRYGSPLSTKEQIMGGPRNAGLMSEAAGLTGFPQFGRQFLKTAQGSQGIEEGLTQGFELPFRYSGGAFTETQKELEKVAKDAGLKGEDLRMFNESTKGLRFSKNEKAAIASGGLPVAQQMIARKGQKSEAGPQEEESGGLLGSLRGLFQGDQAEATESVNTGTDIYWYDGEQTNHIDMSVYTKTATTPKAKAEQAQSRWTDAKDILSIPEDQMSNEQKDEYFKKMGVTREDVEYYDIASENNAYKSMYVRETIANMDRETMMNQLIQWRKNIQDKYILSSGVIDTLVDEGIISSAEGKELKKLDITKQQNGQYRAKMSGRGSGASLKKVKFVQNKIDTKGQKLTSGSDIISIPEAPKIKFQTPNLSKGIKVNVPESPKYKVKFNV